MRQGIAIATATIVLVMIPLCCKVNAAPLPQESSAGQAGPPPAAPGCPAKGNCPCETKEDRIGVTLIGSTSPSSVRNPAVGNPPVPNPPTGSTNPTPPPPPPPVTNSSVGNAPPANQPVANPPAAGKNSANNGASGANSGVPVPAGQPDGNTPPPNPPAGGNDSSNNAAGGDNSGPGAAPAKPKAKPTPRPVATPTAAAPRPPDFNHPIPYVNANGTTESSAAYTYSGDVTTITKKLQVTICQGDDYVFQSADQEVSIDIKKPNDATPAATGVPFGSSIRIFGRHVGGDFVEADVVPTNGGPTVHILVWVNVIDCNTRTTAIPSPVNPVVPNPVKPVEKKEVGGGATPPAVTPAGPNPPTGGNGPNGNPAGGSGGGATPGTTPAGPGEATPQKPCPPCDEDKLVDAVIAAEEATKTAQEDVTTAEENVKTADALMAAAGAALEATPPNSPAYPGLYAYGEGTKQADAAAVAALQTARNNLQTAMAKQETAQKALDDCRKKLAQKDCPPPQTAVNPNEANAIGGGAGGVVQQSNDNTNNALGGNVVASNATGTPASGLSGNSGTNIAVGGGAVKPISGLTLNDLINMSASLFGSAPLAPGVQVIVVVATVGGDGAASGTSSQSRRPQVNTYTALHSGRHASSRVGATFQNIAFHPAVASALPARSRTRGTEAPFGSSAPTSADGGMAFSLAASGNLGKGALEFRVVDPAGRVKNIGIPEGVVLEPLKPGSAKPVGGAAGHVMSQQLTAYCLEMAKLPPEPNQPYRIAPPAIQDRFKSLKPVLEAGSKLAASGQFHPDSEPNAYTDFIRQNALWAKMEGWGEQKFTEVFIERTKKNAEHMKMNWTKEMEQALRSAAPGRWGDISMVLEEAQKISGGSGAAKTSQPAKQ